MDVFFSSWAFTDCTPGLKRSFEHNSVRKNLFLSACFCWDSRLSLREIDQKFKFGRTIGYGDLYLDSVFRYSKVFRTHAMLHDAAGAVRIQTGSAPGYCYNFRRGPNCCLPGHVTGLLFCLYVKIFLASVFNLIDFWISMFSIVLEIELTEKNIITEMGFLLMVLHKDFQSVLQILLSLINRQHGTQVIYMEMGGVVGNWRMRSCFLSFTT